MGVAEFRIAQRASHGFAVAKRDDFARSHLWTWIVSSNAAHRSAYAHGDSTRRDGRRAARPIHYAALHHYQYLDDSDYLLDSIKRCVPVGFNFIRDARGECLGSS